MVVLNRVRQNGKLLLLFLISASVSKTYVCLLRKWGNSLKCCDLFIWVELLSLIWSEVLFSVFLFILRISCSSCYTYHTFNQLLKYFCFDVPLFSVEGWHFLSSSLAQYLSLLQYHPTVYSLALQSPPQILHRIWTQRSVILTEIEVKIGQLQSYNVTRVDLLLLICIFQVMSWHWCIYLPINSVFFHGNFRQSNQHLITCMLYYCAPQCIVTEIVSPKFLKHNIDIGQCFCHTAVNQDT